MTLLLLACHLSLQAGFIWARYAHFRQAGDTPKGARLIEVSALGCIVLGAALIASRDTLHPALDATMGATMSASALALAAASAAVFAWALASSRRHQLAVAFSDDRPAELLTHGAYAFVRNPFYLAYMLAFALPFAASGSAWAAAAALWMGCIYHRAARGEERKFLGSPLAEDYLRYMAATGRFLPRPRQCLSLLTNLWGARHAH